MRMAVFSLRRAAAGWCWVPAYRPVPSAMRRPNLSGSHYSSHTGTGICLLRHCTWLRYIPDRTCTALPMAMALVKLLRRAGRAAREWAARVALAVDRNLGLAAAEPAVGWEAGSPLLSCSRCLGVNKAKARGPNARSCQSWSIPSCLPTLGDPSRVRQPGSCAVLPLLASGGADRLQVTCSCSEGAARPISRARNGLELRDIERPW